MDPHSVLLRASGFGFWPLVLLAYWKPGLGCCRLVTSFWRATLAVSTPSDFILRQRGSNRNPSGHQLSGCKAKARLRARQTTTPPWRPCCETRTHPGAWPSGEEAQPTTLVILAFGILAFGFCTRAPPGRQMHATLASLFCDQNAPGSVAVRRGARPGRRRRHLGVPVP